MPANRSEPLALATSAPATRLLLRLMLDYGAGGLGLIVSWAGLALRFVHRRFRLEIEVGAMG